jgi:predicted amidohydrolase YtcJ
VVSALAIRDGRIIARGSDDSIMAHAGPKTRKIDLKNRRVIPGLNDSHCHLIRGGLNYALEVRWDGVRSLKTALEMLREQAEKTPKGRWVRVVGGWSEHQFEEGRLPTLAEINEATQDTPCFILYLYSLGYLNKAGIEALGYDETTYYPGGELQKDADGKLTGFLIAKPSALLLYSTLIKMPMLTEEEATVSTLHYFQELNRFGLTSAIDAGGGGQYYPHNYNVAERLALEGKLSLRVAYYLFAQEKGKELQNYQDWIKQVRPGHNDDMYKANGYMMHGAGENLTWSAADFENFLEPRPVLGDHMEGDLKPIVELLVKNRWPFRIHATYNESISRFLDTFEEVNREHPFDGLRWIVDHAETVSTDNLRRIKSLGGGVAIQNRLFFQGEHFLERYGSKAAENAPPVKEMLAMGIPVGLGTDSTRVSSYQPWLAIYWLVSGKTWGGQQLLSPENRLSRLEALELMTKGSAWFSSEEEKKGSLELGKFADLAVLKQDYFEVDEEEIRNLEALLTIVHGQPVFGQEEYADLNPELPPIQPSWSPVNTFGGYQK